MWGHEVMCEPRIRPWAHLRRLPCSRHAMTLQAGEGTPARSAFVGRAAGSTASGVSNPWCWASSTTPRPSTPRGHRGTSAAACVPGSVTRTLGCATARRTHLTAASLRRRSLCPVCLRCAWLVARGRGRGCLRRGGVAGEHVAAWGLRSPDAVLTDHVLLGRLWTRCGLPVPSALHGHAPCGRWTMLAHAFHVWTRPPGHLRCENPCEALIVTHPALPFLFRHTSSSQRSGLAIELSTLHGESWHGSHRKPSRTVLTSSRHSRILETRPFQKLPLGASRFPTHDGTARSRACRTPRAS